MQRLDKYEDSDPEVVLRLLNSFYVDDLVCTRSVLQNPESNGSWRSSAHQMAAQEVIKQR